MPQEGFYYLGVIDSVWTHAIKYEKPLSLLVWLRFNIWICYFKEAAYRGCLGVQSGQMTSKFDNLKATDVPKKFENYNKTL